MNSETTGSYPSADPEVGVVPVGDGEPEDDGTLIGKVRIYLAKIYKALKSLVGLTILLVLYSIAGMIIFRLIEYSNEEKEKTSLRNSKEEIIESILNKTLDFRRIGKDIWLQETRKLLVRFEDLIRNTDYSSHADHNTWGWWSALFYCSTIYTTIGYGNITPKTDLGRFVTILYALIGIPLALMVLAEVGKRFTLGLKFLWKFVRRYYYTGYCIQMRSRGKNVLVRGKTAIRRASNRRGHRGRTDENHAADMPETFVDDPCAKDKDGSKVKDAELADDNEANLGGSLCTLSVTSKDSHEPDEFMVDENFNLPISVASAILLVYIFLGAIMYSIWEQWTFMESFYFVFISVSTIGFGDIVPDKQTYFIISSIYLFIGLALVSMCINVAIEYLSTTLDKAKVRMEKARGRISEVGKVKMEQVGRQFDKAKDRARSNFNEAKQRATEVRDIARGKATEVRKDILLNVQKEVNKMKRKKKPSIDSSEGDRSVRALSAEPAPMRSRSEEIRKEEMIPKQHSLEIPDQNRSKSEDRVLHYSPKFIHKSSSQTQL